MKKAPKPLPENKHQIYLIRHCHAGPDQSETGKCYIGQTDLPLSHKGLRQAETLRDWFAPIPLDRIITSDLTRARRTAEIISEKQQVNVESLKPLREINLGTWDGKAFEEIKKKYPLEFRIRGEKIDTFRPPGGESFEDLHNRVIPAFEKLLGALSGNLLIVAHAGVNRVIMIYLLGMPLKNIFRISQDYGIINIFRKRGILKTIHLSCNFPNEP